MLLSQLLIDYLKIDPVLDRLITGLNLDSRLVKPGDLFFAKQGSETDGSLFIEQAIEKGAVAVVADEKTKTTIKKASNIPLLFLPNLSEKIGFIAARFYQFPSRHLSVVGVTGTNGKTSITHFIAEALHEIAKPAAIIGTLGNGVLGQLQETQLTTPDAISLQKILAKFCKEKVCYVAMEVASHALDQYRVAGTQFEIAVFSNLTRDHLDYHKTMEAYSEAKFRLFNSCGAQHGVINADDEYGRKWLEELKFRLPLYVYSTHPLKETDLPLGVKSISVQKAQYTSTGITAVVSTPWGEGVLDNSNLIGEFNLSNLLAALSVLAILGVPFKESLERLGRVHSVNGRLEKLGGGHQPLVVIDYSHTPDALEKALTVLHKYCEGKLWCVFGCGGDRDKGKRPLMGKIAEQHADQLIITDDNPRTEDPRLIVSEILQGLKNPEAAVIEHDRRRAILHAISCAEAGDIVLIAGKGHETYLIIGEERHVFSDSWEAKVVLNSR